MGESADRFVTLCIYNRNQTIFLSAEKCNKKSEKKY